MELGIDECCKSKPLNEVCGGCRYGLLAFYLENQKAVMKYLKEHDYNRFQELRYASFEL